MCDRNAVISASQKRQQRLQHAALDHLPGLPAGDVLVQRSLEETLAG
jgi:hypothetical protein